MSFVKEAFCETKTDGSAGCASFARIATAFALAGSIAWISYIVYHKLEVPDLAGVITLNATLYGINKVSTIANGIVGKS